MTRLNNRSTRPSNYSRAGAFGLNPPESYRMLEGGGPVPKVGHLRAIASPAQRTAPAKRQNRCATPFGLCNALALRCPLVPLSCHSARELSSRGTCSPSVARGTDTPERLGRQASAGRVLVTEARRRWRRGARVTHPRHGSGEVVGEAMVSGCVLVHYDDAPEGTARVARGSDLSREVSHG